MKTSVRMLALVLAVALLACCLGACTARPAKNPADAEAALKEAGYLVFCDNTVMPRHFEQLGYDLTCTLTATKESKSSDGDTKTDLVVVYYFADKENAQKALDKVREYAAEDKDEIADDAWIAPTGSGAMVYYGTKSAFRAAK